MTSMEDLAALNVLNTEMYTIGAVGTEARCSIHGSISEMQRGWQKEMNR